jgi:DNA (cytosine-5)-methyltransferase 1
MNKLRVFEAFKGYGSQSIALDNIGVNHEVVATSEIDSDAIIAYGAIRYDLDIPIDKSDDEIKQWLMDRNIGYDFKKQKSSIPKMKKDKLHKLYNAAIQSNELGDISLINPNDIPDHDLLTYSFPCTDISICGKKEGLEEGSGTRSSLLHECKKVIKTKKPKYLMLENVKNLVGEFKADFDGWVEWLDGQGYNTYWKVLDALDYGIPQHRERVFAISIKKDIDNQDFKFIEYTKVKLTLDDILLNNVGSEFDLSDYMLEQLSEHIDKLSLDKEHKHIFDISQFRRENRIRVYSKYAPTLTARDWKEPRLVFQYCLDDVLEPDAETPIVHNIYGGFNETEPRVFENYSPTIRTASGGGHIPSVYIKEDFYKNRDERIYEDYSPTIRASRTGLKVVNGRNTRKLTPLECFRFMGVRDEHYYKIANTGISNTQLYKLAGNSIVVNVLESIFEELLKSYID